MSVVNNEVCHWTIYYAKSWRKHQELVRYLADRGRRSPTPKFWETRMMVVQGRRQLRRYLRSRFGADIPPGRSPRITAPERVPRTDGEHIKFGEALREYMLLCLAEVAINTAITRVAAELSGDKCYRAMMMFSGELVNAPFECQVPLQVGGSDYFYHRAVWDAMVWAISWGAPCIEASLMAADPAPPYHPDGVRAGSTFSLAGWAHLHLNRNINRRLNAALSLAEQLENLPGTVLLAWEKWTPREDLLPGRGETSFISRVASMLEKLGSESVRLAQADKLAGIHSSTEEALGGGDEDLAEFERQETLHQQLNELEQLARLSPQQEVIWLRLRQGMEIAEIAAEFKISENQVSVQKRNAMKKLIEARKAAGL